MLSGGRCLPRHRASPSRGIVHSWWGRVIRSCRRRKKQKKKRKERETEIRLNRHGSSWPGASTATLIHSRRSSLCFLLSATRFERPDDDFTRYPLLYFCFGLSLFHVGCHSMTGEEYCRRNFQACRHLLLSHSGTRVITSFQLLFPVLDKFAASDAPVNKFES